MAYMVASGYTAGVAGVWFDESGRQKNEPRRPEPRNSGYRLFRLALQIATWFGRTRLEKQGAGTRSAIAVVALLMAVILVAWRNLFFLDEEKHLVNARRTTIKHYFV